MFIVFEYWEWKDHQCKGHSNMTEDGILSRTLDCLMIINQTYQFNLYWELKRADYVSWNHSNICTTNTVTDWPNSYKWKKSNYFQEEDFFKSWNTILERLMWNSKRKQTSTSSKVVAGVEILEKIRLPLILASGVLHEPFAHHVLTDDVVTLLCVINYVSQLFHSLEQKKINHLQKQSTHFLQEYYRQHSKST